MQHLEGEELSNGRTQVEETEKRRGGKEGEQLSAAAVANFSHCWRGDRRDSADHDDNEW